MSIQVDTVVVGGGAMGSATAWQLAKRGADVVLLERFSPGHKNGASHGRSRNFNIAYADATHIAMVLEAGRLWEELEKATGTEILSRVGLVNHGPGVDPTSPDFLRSHGIIAEMMEPEAAHEQWAGIRFDTRVLYTPQAGRVNADAAVTALQAQTVVHGGVVHHDTEVTAIRVRSDGRAEVVTGTETYIANQVVSTLGAWTTKLLTGVVSLPALVVTQEQPAHFAQLDESMVWPSFNHAHDPGDSKYDYWYTGVYGMLTPGEGIKAGWHGVGPVMDPDRRSFEAEPKQLAALQRYAREWLPGADPDAFTAISCTYTTSPDSTFVLDRSGPVIVGAGFSGHGFKFTTAIGRVLADLVDGTSVPHSMFSLTR
jgi:sarcosine oxidase